jgi:hypothetical protein
MHEEVESYPDYKYSPLFPFPKRKRCMGKEIERGLEQLSSHALPKVRDASGDSGRGKDPGFQGMH